MDEIKSHPAPLVAVTYLATIDGPPGKKGEKGETKLIESHWADQLVIEGYCRFASDPDSKGTATIAAGAKAQKPADAARAPHADS